MIKIGITGGIGSGKSIVSSYLNNAGIPVYNCDIEAKRIMNEDKNLISALTDLLGSGAYKDGGLNRVYIADRIFKDKSMLQKVNSIVHPAVINDFEHWALNQPKLVVAMETAILFESLFDRHVDYVINVVADKNVRIARAIKRDNASFETIENRILNQMSDENRSEKSHFIIDNNDNIAITPQIEKMLNKLDCSIK